MRSSLHFIPVVVLLGACTVSKDGLGVAHRPDPNRPVQIRQQLEQNAQAAADATGRPGLLLVGTTGPFRAVDPKDRDGLYAQYLKAAEVWHPGRPAGMSEDQFVEKLAGWASVQTWGIPGVMSMRARVLVSTDGVKGTQFASAGGSFMFGTTGDLIAARSDDDGIVWLERVLCKDQAGYRDCAKQYRSGFFDANTGQELDKTRKPKPDGARIDTTTYVGTAHP
jgi:hypothetical protein